MGIVSTRAIGAGTVTVDNYSPSVGDYVTITCTPDAGESLIDVYAEYYPSRQPIAIYPDQLVQSFPVNSSEDIDIVATFTEPTPPPPTPTSKRKHMPIWMYPLFRQRR